MPLLTTQYRKIVPGVITREFCNHVDPGTFERVGMSFTWFLPCFTDSECAGATEHVAAAWMFGGGDVRWCDTFVMSVGVSAT